MGLEMKTKQELTNEVSKRYQQTVSKKEKTKILDEFVKITGCNRKYALHTLKNWGKARIVNLDGQAVRLTAKTSKARKKHPPRFRYGPEVIAVITRIWEFFDCQRGQLLVPMIRLMIDLLQAYKTFGITENIKIKLLPVSSSTVNRRLKPERKSWN